MRGSPYSVIVCDLFEGHRPGHETWVVGFPDAATATEYARRRTWSSVEEARRPGASREQVRDTWRAMGEDCRVVGPEGVVHVASSELDRFLARSPGPEERDWVGLYRSLLPGDFGVVYDWAEGSVPPPYHHEYRVEVGADQAGLLRYWHDYPGPGVDPREASFTAPLERCLLLHNLLRAAGLLEGPPAAPPEAELAVGGATGHLLVTAAGRRVEIPVHLLPDDEGREVHEAVRALVPAYAWREVGAAP